jgi:hypothetical protein
MTINDCDNSWYIEEMFSAMDMNDNFDHLDFTRYVIFIATLNKSCHHKTVIPDLIGNLVL